MSIVEGPVLAKKKSTVLEAYGSEDENSFTVRNAVRRRKLLCVSKKYLTGF